jgi:Xaa-Pro aminopeptidase
MNNFSQAHFEDAIGVLEEARRIKSDAEIRCLELGCEVGDKVIKAIVDTAKVGVKNYEIRAMMMDTLFREGCEPSSLLLYHSGKEIHHAGQGLNYTAGDTDALEPGDVILTEFDAKYLGYKAQYNQPFSVGEPGKEWREIFSVALEAFNSGFNALRPGITAGELDQAFLSPIKESDYTYTYCAFHGIGLSLEEPIGALPVQFEYKPSATFRIEAGMVLEFEPHVVTLDGKKGLHLGSPVLVIETGCKLLSKTWKPEFKIV